MVKNSWGYTEVFVLVIVILGAFLLAGGQLLFQSNTDSGLSQPSAGGGNSSAPTPTPTSGSTPIPTPVTCGSGSWILKATAFCEGNVSNIKYDYEMPDGIRAAIETYQNPNGHLNPSGLEDISSGPPNLIGKGTYVAKGNRLSPPNNGLKNNHEYTTEYHNGSITLGASLICSLKIKTLGCPAIIPIP